MKIEHLITVKTRAKDKKPPQKWPVEPSDRSKLLIRRKAGFIEFYDLGQINIGTAESPIWITHPWTFPATLSVSGTTLTDVSEMTTAQFHSSFITDEILAVPREDWSTTFRKLEYEDAESYGLDLVLENVADSFDQIRRCVAREGSRYEQFDFGGAWPATTVSATTSQAWVSQGFKKHPTHYLHYAQNSLAFRPWLRNFPDASNSNITTTFNFSAPGTDDFRLDKPTKFYLVPQPYAITVRFASNWYGGYIYSFMHRDIWRAADVTFPASFPNPNPTDETMSPFIYPVSPFDFFSNFNEVTATTNEAVGDHVRALANAQSFNDTTGAVGDMSLIPAGDPTGEISYMQDGGFLPGSVGGMSSSGPRPLCMIAHQGSSTYYFFSTDSGTRTFGTLTVV